MENTKVPVLLVIDFTGRNFPSALYAVQQWVSYVNKSKNYETVIGILTSLRRGELLNPNGDLTVGVALKMIKDYCQGQRIVIWDRNVDDIVVDILTKEGISLMPIYSDFNYGSIINKGLLLANEMRCRYLIRVDPGTRPPKYDFDIVLKKHIDFINRQSTPQRHVVVSLGYEQRIGVRDIFVIPDNVLEHHDLIAEMTGVDVYAQVTGGALFTSAVPGIPAIPFEKSENAKIGTLVWTSDDALYQLIEETKGSKPLRGIEVPRFDIVGKLKTTFEYYRGVTGMVFLSALVHGLNVQQAVDRVENFIKQLKPLLDSVKCQKNDEEEFKKEYKRELDWPRDFNRELIAPDEFLRQIEKGWENYRTLLKEWSNICSVLVGKLSSHIEVE